MLKFIALGLLLGYSGAERAAQDRWRRLEGDGKAPLSYVMLLPDGHRPGDEAPVLLALPPGGQDEAMVERGLELYFETEAFRRDWVVVSPAAPSGVGFADGGEHRIGALLDQVAKEVKIEGGRVHLAGVSNGGRGAFRIARAYPDRVASLSVLPGAPAADEDWDGLVDFAQLPISLFVGERDADWLAASQRAAKRLEELGAPDVQLVVRAGEEHVLDPGVSAELSARLESIRARQAERRAARADVGAVIDELHAAASAGDGERYFAVFAPGSVFIGTDATEHWSLAEFRGYALARFEEGTSWTYDVLERRIDLSDDGSLAWFEERLLNEKYGETRGSGVLTRRDGQWRIAQYVLSFAIPNDAAGDVVERVRAADTGTGR